MITTKYCFLQKKTISYSSHSARHSNRMAPSRFSKKSNTFCFKTTVVSFIFALFLPSTRSTRRPNLSQKHPQRPRHVTRLVGWRYWWVFQIWSFLAAQQKPVEISQQKPLKIGQKLKETSLSKLVSTHRTGTHP